MNSKSLLKNRKHVERQSRVLSAVHPGILKRLRKNPSAKEVELTGSPVLCSHANEVPASCDCSPECYCKSNTCDSTANKNLPDVRSKVLSNLLSDGTTETDKTRTVALEDMVTCVILEFMESAKKIGWNGKKPIQEWYLSLTPEQMYKVSDKLLDILNPSR
jgi:hypothetical protein